MSTKLCARLPQGLAAVWYQALETMFRDIMYAINWKCILLLPDILAKDN